MDNTTDSSVFLKKAKSIRVRSIVGIVLFCTLLLSPIALILAIVDGVTILSTNWDDKNLKEDATLWGILALVVLANIGSLVFANKAIDIYKNRCPN